jgi:hypothetical protein
MRREIEYPRPFASRQINGFDGLGSDTGHHCVTVAVLDAEGTRDASCASWAAQRKCLSLKENSRLEGSPGGRPDGCPPSLQASPAVQEADRDRVLTMIHSK